LSFSPHHPIATALWTAVAAALLALAWLSGAVGAAASYVLLMLAPGLALYFVVERHPRLLEALASSLVASPVLVVVPAVAAMAAGVSAPTTARALEVAAAAFLALSSLRAESVSSGGLSTRHYVVLAGFVIAVCALTAYLPLTNEWWRIRSDAWAHRAYIAEIADFGVPPQDPYFRGFPLQYMWAYHVLMLVVADAGRFDPFWMMAFLNVQALAGLIVATFLFAGTMVHDFARKMMSVVTVTLGMNAAFWVFLPVKVLKAFTGDTRGMEEIARQFSLSPLTYRTATGFMTIFHNKTFFLDKFMVGTAFGFGLCLMAATWYAASSYLRRRRTFPLAFILVTTLGMLAFHTLVGSVMLVGTFGGLALLFLRRRSVDGYRLPRTVRLAGAMLAAFVIALPYVYAVLHSKDTVGQIDLPILGARVIGVAISLAFVLVLVVFQGRFLRLRGVVPRFVVLATAVITAYAMLVPLPGPNSFDKPVFFAFFPLAVVGAWSLVDLAERRGWALAALVAAVAFVPVNGLALAGCFRTPPDWTISAEERDAAGWLGEHTPRDATLLDDDDRVVFVTLSPRRHLWGRLSFAAQWGYDRLEMSRRYHAWRVVYSDEPLDANTLSCLGSVESDLYVVLRKDRHADGVNVRRHPEYFHPVYDNGAIEVLSVDTERCREDAVSGRFPTIPEEELFRESGLK